MTIYTASQARKDFEKIIDAVTEAHEPAYIVGQRNNIVIMSQEDFQAIQKALSPTQSGQRS